MGVCCSWLLIPNDDTAQLISVPAPTDTITAAPPSPLLRDIRFGNADDAPSSTESIDDDEIERLIAEEEEDTSE